jgi:hypothetical protein
MDIPLKRQFANPGVLSYKMSENDIYYVDVNVTQNIPVPILMIQGTCLIKIMQLDHYFTINNGAAVVGQLAVTAETHATLTPSPGIVGTVVHQVNNDMAIPLNLNEIKIINMGSISAVRNCNVLFKIYNKAFEFFK